MKKSLLFIAVLTLYSAFCFSSVELSPRLFGDFLITKYDTEAYSENFTITDFGTEAQGNFWFAKSGKFEFGLSAGLDLGGGIFKIEAEDNVNSSSVTEENSQFTFGLSIAPAIQATFGWMHSFYVAPGFRFAFTRVAVSDGNTSETPSYFIPEFSAEVGYKLWLWENLSLTAGYKYELPLSIIGSSTIFTFDRANAHRFFAGVSWKVFN